MLSKNIILNYIYDYNYPNEMNKLDWEKYIFNLFETLKLKPNGLIIYNRLHYFLNSKNIIISNNKNIDNLGHYIFIPAFYATYKIPYLTEPLSSFEGDTNEMKSIHKITEQIYNYKESNFLLTTKHFTDLEELIEYSDEDFLSIFVNQIIRTLRFFEGIQTKEEDLENGSIIYGLNGFSLKIDNNLITENVVRKEWDKSPRISQIYFITYKV